MPDLLPRAGERFSFVRRHEFGLLMATAAVVVIATLVDRNHSYWYKPWDSLVDITRQASLLGMFALGAAVVIIAGGIDLSSGSVIAFSGTVCATLLLLLAPEEMRRAQPLPLWVMAVAVTGTLLVGFLIGSLHAWLITVVELPPFVATLATLVGLRSFGRAIVGNVTLQVLGSGSTQIQIYDDRFRYLATSVWIPAVLFAALALAGWVMLSRTVVGRHLYALGGNEEAARLSGLRTDRLKWLAYCISAVLSSLAGVFYICDQSTADPQTLGRGYELNAIAAAVVGGCSLQGGAGTVPGTVLGVIFLRTVIDGVAKIIKTGADVFEGLIVGVVVVLAVAFTQLRSRGEQRKQFFSGALGLVAIINLAVIAGAMTALMGPELLAAIDDALEWPFGTRLLARVLPSDTASLSGLVAVGTLAVLGLVRLQVGRRVKQLAALLLAVLFLAAALTLHYGLPYYRQTRAVTFIEHAGGRVETLDDGGLLIDLEGQPIDDTRLVQIVDRAQALHGVQELNLAGTKITNQGLKHLERLPGLRRLDVRQTNVTRGGIRILTRKLPDLEVTSTAP
jgi:ribose/xylose/arabinose/galactoside ABC-type transport system permease subunit